MRSSVDSNSIDAKRMVLEITETAAVQFFEESRRKLQFLKEMRFRIALDDFGTGHSSLNYLLQLPVDQD
jgi:EAL domain-containing protein (putative c-di-GMP-specific phosphodiesterase class I)